MLASTLSVLAIAAGLVAAQTTANSSGPDIGDVTPTMRSQWCTGETNTCPLLCGGLDYTANNTCDSVGLTSNCTCQNGTSPDLAAYQDTLSFYLCQAEYKQCIIEHPNDSKGQANCTATFVCGSLDASDVPNGAGASSASSAAPSSTSASSTAAPAAASTTSGTPAATSTAAKAAAHAIKIGGEYGTGVMMGGLLAVFGLFL